MRPNSVSLSTCVPKMSYTTTSSVLLAGLAVVGKNSRGQAILVPNQQGEPPFSSEKESDLLAPATHTCH